MFATQRNHQISSKVLSTDQRSPMIRRHRITTLTQHRARLLIGAIAHASDGARTGHPHHITQTALPQLLSEQRRSHHRSSAIETAYKRDVQPRATHNPYRFPSSAAGPSESAESKFATVVTRLEKRFELRTDRHMLCQPIVVGMGSGMAQIGLVTSAGYELPRRVSVDVRLSSSPVPISLFSSWVGCLRFGRRSETLAPMPTTRSRLRRCSPSPNVAKEWSRPAFVSSRSSCCRRPDRRCIDTPVSPPR